MAPANDPNESSSRPDATPESRIALAARRRATIAMISLRIAYAYNWLDIGPGLPTIGTTFGIGTSGWGVLVASFLVGAGLLQVPAGLLARSRGTRAVSIAGAAVLGVASLACAFAPSFPVLVGLRFLAGAGAGLFFSPAIALVASLHPGGERGIPVGTFSSAFSAGAGLGVFATAVLIPSIGWRGALGIGGVLLLVLLALAMYVIPRSAGAPPARAPARPTGWPAALRSPAVWGLGLAFMGLEGASLSAGQYFVPYAQLVRGWAPALAGAVGALFVFPSVFGGPVGGRLAERFANRRTQMLLATAVPALLIALIPFVPVGAIAVFAIVFSFTYGIVYAVMYMLPDYLPELPAEEKSLAIGLFNGIQLGGGAAIAAIVATVVERSGYTIGWVSLGVAAIVTLAFFALIPATGKTPNAATAGHRLPADEAPAGRSA